MAGMMAGKPKLTMKVPIVVQSGELALLFRLHSYQHRPDGKQTSIRAWHRGGARQADGTWRLLSTTDRHR